MNTVLIEAVCIAVLLGYSQYAAFRAGVFSFATTGFALVGAYASALLETRLGLPFAISVVLAVVIGTAFATLVAVLIAHLRGIYQGIATLALALMLKEAALTWSDITGGAFGITGVTRWATILPLLVLVAIVVACAMAFDRSGFGVQSTAVRIDEMAAASVGVHVKSIRFNALVVSGALGALAGAAMTGNQYFIYPNSFGMGLLIQVLGIAIIGGYRSWPGPLLGAVFVIFLPTLLGSLAEYQQIVVGLAMILVILFLPGGLGDLGRIALGFLRRMRLQRAHASTPGAAIERLAATSDKKEAPGDRSAIEAGDRVDDDVEVLSIADARRAFSGITAVDGVSLEIRPGEVVGLIGPNGAGKTTAVNLVCGVYKLDSGAISLGDVRIETWQAHELARHGIVRTFQTCRLFEGLSVRDNIRLAASHRRLRPADSRLAAFAGQAFGSDHEFYDKLMDQLGITPLADIEAVKLPYAHQRRVEISRALALEPKYIMLDEPAAGMSEVEAEDLMALVRQIADRGVGVLVIDHNVGWMLSLCDRIAVMNVGRVIAEGTPDEIRTNEDVKAAYLG